MSLSPGLRLGAYEIVALVGSGGMGEVYRARDTRLGRDVAIKVPSGAFSTDSDRLRRFEQESRAGGPTAKKSSIACAASTTWRRTVNGSLRTRSWRLPPVRPRGR